MINFQKQTIYFLFIFVVLLLFSNTAKSQLDSNLLVFSNSRYIKVNDILLHYRTWNHTSNNFKGKVLLVHGFCGSTFSWRKNIDTLIGSGYDVVALDMPAFGYSDRNPKINHSQSSRADLFWQFVNQIDSTQSKWNLIGHSMGGGVVEAMALMQPEKTKSVMFVDGLMFKKNKNYNILAQWYLRFPPTEKIYVFIADKIFFKPKRIKKMIESIYFARVDSEIVDGYLTPLLIKGTSKAIINSFSRSKEIAKLNIKDLHTPSLAVWGSSDNLLTLSFGLKRLRFNESIDIYVFNGAGHCPMETKTEQFNKVLIGFLNANN